MAGIRARFNTKYVICVFKTKVFVYKSLFLITYSYNIGVFKSEFLI
jgi:hypothetical protein